MTNKKLTLAKALRLDQIPAPRVAFVGAGGKTTALFQTARELAPCIVTTTTHLGGAWQAAEADEHIIVGEHDSIQDRLHPSGYAQKKSVVLVTGAEKKNRLTSLSDDKLNWLAEYCESNSLPLLIEADGARSKPLKAPKAHEPVVPNFVDTVVVVAGLSGVGKNLAEENVYNADGFSKLQVTSHKLQEKTVTAELLVNALLHSEGGLKNIPANARKVALLNQADTPKRQATGGKIAKELISPRSDDFSRQRLRTEVLTTRGYDAVIVASLKPSNLSTFQHSPQQTFEQSAAIILAAGSSSRFGEPKQLLDYHGKPFIRAVTEVALQAELAPIVVVTGAEHDKISAVLADLPVIVVQNPNWADGQSSSIQVGVKNLNKNTGSAFFLLADQPHITPTVIRALVEEHARTLYPVIAPLVEDRRANPVLFDRVTFPALMKLKGDIGGRGIFSKFPAKYIHWNDSGLLLDVDTPEAYKKLIER